MNENGKSFDCVAIVTDLDGTYLAKGGVVHPANVQAVTAFCKKGGYFTYGTGRMHKNIARVLPDSKSVCNLPAVVANGSYLFDFARGERMYPTSMRTEDVICVASYAREIAPAVGVRVVTPDGFMSDGHGEDIKREITRVPFDFPHVLPVSDWARVNPTQQWFKLVFRGEAADLETLRPYLVERFGDRFEFAISGPRFLELTAKGCTKASGVQRLRELLAAQGKRVFVVACGDQENDLAMLRCADLALCPENATDAVKSLCASVLRHHDQGMMPEVVAYIEKMMR